MLRATIAKQLVAIMVLTTTASMSRLQAMVISAIARRAVRCALDVHHRDVDKQQLALLHKQQHSKRTSLAQEATGTSGLRGLVPEPSA